MVNCHSYKFSLLTKYIYYCRNKFSAKVICYLLYCWSTCYPWRWKVWNKSFSCCSFTRKTVPLLPTYKHLYLNIPENVESSFFCLQGISKYSYISKIIVNCPIIHHINRWTRFFVLKIAIGPTFIFVFLIKISSLFNRD